jgi:hypothetical protein
MKKIRLRYWNWNKTGTGNRKRNSGRVTKYAIF